MKILNLKYILATLFVALPMTVFVSCSDDEMSDQDKLDYYADKWVKDDFSQCPMDMVQNVMKGSWHCCNHAYGKPLGKEGEHDIEILDDDVLVTRKAGNIDHHVFDIKKWEITEGKLTLTLYPNMTMVCDSIMWNNNYFYMTCVTNGDKYIYQKYGWGTKESDLTWARYWYGK